jgi:hypothetical protein
MGVKELVTRDTGWFALVPLAQVPAAYLGPR